jgi:hypothetical protein
MKKYVFVAAMAVALAASSSAWSRSTSSAGTSSASQPAARLQAQPMAGQQGQQLGNPPNFQQMKSQILAHMNENLADLQKRIPCVQAAKDDQGLRACLPPPPPPPPPGFRGQENQGGGPGMGQAEGPMGQPGGPGMGPMGAPNAEQGGAPTK